jgi:hypothetical protein
MTTVDHLAGIWGGSLCLWGLCALYCHFSIMRFIVKRYEQETDLLNTVFFTKHATFARYLHSFHSSAIYTSHLLMCTWGWRFYRKRKNFRDIENPEVVTRHFSSNEIWRVKRTAIVGGIVVLHWIAYFIFKTIWPEVFS